MRWLVLAIPAALLLMVGCSGQGVLVVHNLSNGSVSVKVISNEKRHDFLDTGVTQGEEIESIRWHGLPPEWIEVTVNGKSGHSDTRKWLLADYPPMMRDGSSLTEYFVLEIHENRMLLRDPTTWDAVRRNPLSYGFLALWPIGILVGVVLAIRRRILESRHPQRSRGI